MKSGGGRRRTTTHPPSDVILATDVSLYSTDGNDRRPVPEREGASPSRLFRQDGGDIRHAINPWVVFGD